MLTRQPYHLTNVLVAGRRLSGDAHGTDEREAVRRFAAREARVLGADPAGAAAEALRARGYRAVVTKTDDVTDEVDELIAEPGAANGGSFVDWPMRMMTR